MRILVTGAGGFIGRRVVEQASARGHEVRALVRPASVDRATEQLRAGVDVRAHDLRNPEGLSELLEDIDVVVHLAAKKQGDLHEQLQHTVVATEHLVSAMQQSGVRSAVLLGSFTVYDFANIPPNTRIDERSPLEPTPTDRDAYTLCKRLQEDIFRTQADNSDGWSFSVLRAGAVWGPDEWWSARLGLRFGRRWIAIGRSAQIPLTYVVNAAHAVVLAAERPSSGYRVINVVDDEPPTQRQHLRALRARAAVRPSVVTVPYAVARGAGVIVDVVNRRLFGGYARVPNFVTPAALTGRGRPYRYGNRRLHEMLGWEPIVSYPDALDLTFGTG